MATFSQGTGGQRWPFDTMLTGFEVGGIVYADVFNQPVELTQAIAVSEDRGMGDTTAYIFVYDEGDIEVGVDPPEMVIPVPVGIDPNLSVLSGFFVVEDGVPGQLWNELTFAVNAVPDENTRQLSIPEGPVYIGLTGVKPTE